jgi:hypothetical protein
MLFNNTLERIFIKTIKVHIDEIDIYCILHKYCLELLHDFIYSMFLRRKTDDMKKMPLVECCGLLE